MIASPIYTQWWFWLLGPAEAVLSVVLFVAALLWTLVAALFKKETV